MVVPSAEVVKSVMPLRPVSRPELIARLLDGPHAARHGQRNPARRHPSDLRGDAVDDPQHDDAVAVFRGDERILGHGMRLEPELARDLLVGPAETALGAELRAPGPGADR